MQSKSQSLPSDRHPSEWLALTFGAVYLVVGVVGFFVTGFDDFAGETGEKVIVFELNPLHNIVHIAIGVLGLGLGRTLTGAKTYGAALAVGYGAVFVYGLFAVGNRDLSILSLNTADNLLHLGTAIAGVVIAAWPANEQITVTSR